MAQICVNHRTVPGSDCGGAACFTPSPGAFLGVLCFSGPAATLSGPPLASCTVVVVGFCGGGERGWVPKTPRSHSREGWKGGEGLDGKGTFLSHLDRGGLESREEGWGAVAGQGRAGRRAGAFGLGRALGVLPFPMLSRREFHRKPLQTCGKSGFPPFCSFPCSGNGELGC